MIAAEYFAEQKPVSKRVARSTTARRDLGPGTAFDKWFQNHLRPHSPRHNQLAPELTIDHICAAVASLKPATIIIRS